MTDAIKSNATILDLDAMMDQDMGSVETLPEFVTPSKGLYVLSIKDAGLETKDQKNKETGEVEKKSRFRILWEIVSSKETEEPPFPDGSLFQTSYQATDEGLKFFKRDAMKFLNVKDLTGAKLRDVFDGLKEIKGMNAAITVTQTESSTKPGTVYTNINIRALHG